MLGEAAGRIRTEDLLPLFPAYATLDAFRGAICGLLEEHIGQVGQRRAQRGTPRAWRMRCGARP